MNLVTGATGLLGSHVILNLLQNGQQVVACKRKDSDLKRVESLFSHYTSRDLFEKITWVDLDINDLFAVEDALDGITNVYHCAGMVSFGRSERKELFKVNESGTRNIVNACLTKKGINLCHVSSVATLHNLDYQLPLDERVVWKKSGRESDYAISKYNGEREVWRGMEEGLNAVIVNPGVILGLGFWNQSSSKMVTTGARGNRFFTPGMAGYISARDTADVMRQLVEKQCFHERFILIENSYSYRQIFTMLNEAFGNAPPSISINKFWLSVAAALDSVRSAVTGKAPTVTYSIVNAAFNKQVCSNQKIIKTLSFNFQPISSVIKEIAESYKKDAQK